MDTRRVHDLKRVSVHDLRRVSLRVHDPRRVSLRVHKVRKVRIHALLTYGELAFMAC